MLAPRGARRLSALALVVGFAALCSRSSEASPGQDIQSSLILSAHTDLVVLNVSVQERSPREDGERLRPESFAVYEDGRRQAVSVFLDKDEPATVGLLIDNSSSMLRSRKLMIAAGLAFARSVSPEDELFVVHFNERVSFGLPAGVPFTSDLGLLHQALAEMRTRGRTALYDAIATGLDRLSDGTRQRRVLVVVSDGGDNASTSTFGQVLDLARRTDAIIFAVGLIDEFGDDANPKALKTMARATGGELWKPRKPEDIEAVLERIASEIRRGYTLGYVSQNSHRDGSYRRIRVEARASDGEKLSVRVREGYIAASEQVAR